MRRRLDFILRIAGSSKGPNQDSFALSLSVSDKWIGEGKRVMGWRP